MCVDADLGEESQAVHAIAGQADAIAVVPGRFELAEFATHHFIARAVVPFHVDATHINTTCRLAAQDERHPFVDTIDLGRGFNLSECVAKGTVVIGEGLHRAGDVFGVVGLTGAQGDERLEFLFLAEVFAFQCHRRHDVTVALGDVEGDRHVLLVGRNRHLRGVDAELEVAAGQVVRAQRFDVGVEFGARVAVRLGVPAQPAARVQIEQVAQGRLGEGLVAHDPDVLDLGHIAFDHAEIEIDPVALARRDGGHHLRCVHALADVLALEFLLGPVGQRFVERPAFGQTNVAQCLGEHLVVKFLDAGEAHIGHRGAFFHDHHQHITIDLQANVAEQAEAEQRPDGG